VKVLTHGQSVGLTLFINTLSILFELAGGQDKQLKAPDLFLSPFKLNIFLICVYI
jgi:hypothetical protein